MNSAESRPRRLTRAETKARTRALLLDAAAEVFARKGFTGASVDDIAESAGFSVGALYSNFASKEELFVELLSGRNNSVLAQAAAILSDADRGLDQARAALSHLLIDVADAESQLAPLEAEFWLYAIRRPEFLEPLAARFRERRDTLAEVLAERARERTQPADAPFAEAATVVLALFNGLVQLRRTDPELVSEQLYDDAVHWLFRGLNATVAERSATGPALVEGV